ncbi:MAG: inorganic pyrophosphatase [bacterium]
MENKNEIWQLFGKLFRAHPWHGIPLGNNFPDTLNVFIEIVPSDTVKYEVDKLTGFLKIDRPQRFSNVTPTLYGFIPQTYCGNRVAQLCDYDDDGFEIKGDGDPLDICILTEKTINQGGIILQAKPVGGIKLIDGADVDDKIIAVLKDDAVYDSYQDIKDVPKKLIDRLRHYFLTYKQIPGLTPTKCFIVDIYGKDEALKVITASREDYIEKFGDMQGTLFSALTKELNGK